MLCFECIDNGENMEFTKQEIDILKRMSIGIEN